MVSSEGTLLIRLALLFSFTLTMLPAAAGAKAVDFNRDIRPILSDHCFACHGPDEQKRMAGVRLDTAEGVRAAFPAGSPDKSRGYIRISHPDARRRMPPPSTGRQLSEQQIDMVKRWIEAGAEYKIHWAFETPVRPAPPPVRDARWARNPIDRFVLARLDKEGLKPSPEADRATLLRRLSFDLTGLPPSPAEIDAFVNDRSPRAYEKQVERLLASPHYGERMTMHWLDLARYADTHGFHIDSHRDMWPWRDWVIRAFNANMPFDRFTIEQLAGDLLPDATLDQKIASGFNRNHMINYEGGAIEEEYRTEYVADRVETTSTVWLGLTMGCARCHDHKYDPIPQKDYYRMFAFFNNVEEKGLDGKDGNAQPFLALPTGEQKRRLDDLVARIKTREAELADAKVKPLFEAWQERQKIAWEREDLAAHYEMDGGFADSSGHYRHGRWMRGEWSGVAAPVGRAVAFTTPGHVVFEGVRLGETFTIAAWLQQGHHEPQTVFSQPGRVEVWYDASEPLPHLRRGAHLHVEAGGRHVRTRERLVQGEMYHAAIVAADGGIEVYINGARAETDAETPGGAAGAAGAADCFAIGQAKDTDERNGFRGRLADLRLYDRPLGAAHVEQMAVHGRAAALLAIPAGKRTKEQTETLRAYFLTHGAPEAMRTAWSDLRELKRAKARLDDEIPNTMVMREASRPRDTFILGRGDYRHPGEKVTAGTPAVLPPLPDGAAANRLALARWLVDPRHPLTARVAVNRFWQNLFGTGLVKTAENFGSQGDPPSHPELLDWLAAEFVSSGWDVKALHRLLVTSAAYRQSSKATPELIERDPENRLLARMSRFRLPAETVRDSALAASGLLRTRIGGPSVYPYQPDGIWEEIARGEIFSAQVYKQSHGDDLYRRSMYWFWKRTAPPTSLTTFDAPDREKCTARRPLTNTPLQALVLLNDPAFVEASRVLAERALRVPDTTRRVEFVFRAVTGRKPRADEVKVLAGLAERQLARFSADSGAARRLIAVGETKPAPDAPAVELAAWTNVAAAVMNTDEAITKE